MQIDSLLRIGFRVAVIVSLTAVGWAQQPESEWKPVEAAIGRAGQMQPGEVMKFSMPRKDLRVTVGGTEIKPGLALGSWVAFKKMGPQAMAMGDLVLAESEVEPVMKRLEDEGVQITALHNHLLNESPRVMYMHIMGRGDATKLAQAIASALSLTRTPPAVPPSASAEPEATELDTAAIEQALGRKGKVNSGLLQFSVPRAEKITENGMAVPPAMGTATGINFQSTAKGRAATTGDFVLLASEVNPVIAALRRGGMQVTAVHSHMLTEEPRLFFLHFWGNDDAAKLATTLRRALDATNSAR